VRVRVSSRADGAGQICAADLMLFSATQTEAGPRGNSCLQSDGGEHAGRAAPTITNIEIAILRGDASALSRFRFLYKSGLDKARQTTEDRRCSSDRASPGGCHHDTLAARRLAARIGRRR